MFGWMKNQVVKFEIERAYVRLKKEYGDEYKTRRFCLAVGLAAAVNPTATHKDPNIQGWIDLIRATFPPPYNGLGSYEVFDSWAKGEGETDHAFFVLWKMPADAFLFKLGRANIMAEEPNLDDSGFKARIQSWMEKVGIAGTLEQEGCLPEVMEAWAHLH